MIEILISCLGFIISFIVGINYGKKDKSNEINKQQIKNVKKSCTIDNIADNDIIRMYDKYE